MAVIEQTNLIEGPSEPLNVAVRTLTAAEVLALHTTPIEVVEAPTAGQYVIVEGIFASLDFDSAAYAGVAATEDFEFRYTNAAGTEIMDVETTGFLTASADAVRWTPADASVVTPVAAAPVVVRLPSAVTTGDSPVTFRVYYRIIAP